MSQFFVSPSKLNLLDRLQPLFCTIILYLMFIDTVSKNSDRFKQQGQTVLTEIINSDKVEMMKLLRHQRNVSKDAIALVNSRLLNFHPSCWYFYWCNLPLIARLLQMGILQFNLEVRVTFIIYSFHQNELFLFGSALLLESLSFWWISLLAALIKESAGVVILDVLLKVHIITKN